MNTAAGCDEFPREFLQSIDLPTLLLSILHLKVGAPIMLLRNIRPSEGLYNGTRLVVSALSQRIIHATILTGDRKGCRCLISRIQLRFLEGTWNVIL